MNLFHSGGFYSNQGGGGGKSSEEVCEGCEGWRRHSEGWGGFVLVWEVVLVRNDDDILTHRVCS